MKVDMRRAAVAQTMTLSTGTHVIELRDGSGEGGRIDLFVGSDWADWDAIVAAVAAYRASQTEVSA